MGEQMTRFGPIGTASRPPNCKPSEQVELTRSAQPLNLSGFCLSDEITTNKRRSDLHSPIAELTPLTSNMPISKRSAQSNPREAR